MPLKTKFSKHSFARDMPVFLQTIAVLLLLMGEFASANTGFSKLISNGVEFGIWYPTDTPAVEQRLGPFQTKVALNAPVQEGKHQIVIFSHGHGGRFRNHHLTAQTLADAGYIVIAPQHEADYLVSVGSRKVAAALDHRYLELQTALEAVRANPDFNPYLASGPVHGVGYSLGGAAIMLGAGAVFDSSKIDEHCDRNELQDPDFFKKSNFLFRLIQSFFHDVNLRPTSDPFRHDPIITGKVVLIAPVYHGLDIENGLSLIDVRVIAITGDNVAQPRFHAIPLQKAINRYVPSLLTSIKGHHYAFISPFPKWATDEEDIPVAHDPEGFDRPAFLQTVNAIIVEVINPAKD